MASFSQCQGILLLRYPMIVLISQISTVMTRYSLMELYVVRFRTKQSQRKENSKYQPTLKIELALTHFLLLAHLLFQNPLRATNKLSNTPNQIPFN